MSISSVQQESKCLKTTTAGQNTFGVNSIVQRENKYSAYTERENYYVIHKRRPCKLSELAS